MPVVKSDPDAVLESIGEPDAVEDIEDVIVIEDIAVSDKFDDNVAECVRVLIADRVLLDVIVSVFFALGVPDGILVLVNSLDGLADVDILLVAEPVNEANDEVDADALFDNEEKYVSLVDAVDDRVAVFEPVAIRVRILINVAVAVGLAVEDTAIVLDIVDETDFDKYVRAVVDGV